MTPDSDILPTPQSQIFSKAAQGAAAASSAVPLEDIEAVSLFQEINERRARIEKPELLRQLRGL